MKKIILTLAVVCGMQFAFAQDIKEAQVPAVILNTYKQNFKSAKFSDWEIKSNGMYEVEFKTSLTGKDHTALFTPEGKLYQHKQELATKDLPAAVTASIKKDFKGYRIDDVDRIDQQGKVTYKVSLKSNAQDYDVVIGANGSVISKKLD